MAIVFTGESRADAGQEFTSDKRLLLAAVETFTGQEAPARALPQPRGPAIGGQSPRLFTLDGNERKDHGLRVMAALTQVASWLDGVRGRKKSVLLVSGGFQYDLQDLVLDTASGGRIGRTNTTFFSIDMRGPGTAQNPVNPLRMLADDTGGLSVIDNNDIDRGFNDIVAANSTYYVLAYYPSHPRDDKFHRIQVRVKRPGVTVRSRRGAGGPVPVHDADATGGFRAGSLRRER